MKRISCPADIPLVSPAIRSALLQALADEQGLPPPGRGSVYVLEPVPASLHCHYFA